MVCVGQLSAILGPLLALKGPQGSLGKALDNMKEERTRLFWLFILGMGGFYSMIVSLLWIWVEEYLWLEIVATLLISCFFGLMAQRVRHMMAEYSFTEVKLETLVHTGAEITEHLGLRQNAGTFHQNAVHVHSGRQGAGSDTSLVTASAYLGLTDKAAGAGQFRSPAEGEHVKS